MSDLEFLEKVRSICKGVCKDRTLKGSCPFFWIYCDVDTPFYEMTDEDLQRILFNVSTYVV